MSGSATTTAVAKVDDSMHDRRAEADEPAAQKPASGMPAEQARKAPAVSASGGVLLNGLLMIAIAVISGAIGAVIYERMQPPAQRIMVLDMGALLKPIADDPTLNELEKRRITEDIGASLEQAMRQEADKGAIILDAAMVLKAPGDSYVKP